MKTKYEWESADGEVVAVVNALITGLGMILKTIADEGEMGRNNSIELRRLDIEAEDRREERQRAK